MLLNSPTKPNISLISGTAMTRVTQSVNKQHMIPIWRFHAKSACGNNKKFTAFRA